MNNTADELTERLKQVSSEISKHGFTASDLMGFAISRRRIPEGSVGDGVYFRQYTIGLVIRSERAARVASSLCRAFSVGDFVSKDDYCDSFSAVFDCLEEGKDFSLVKSAYPIR